ncbi:MAG: hypothetical protein OXG64_06675 [Chloroflexi bacterium]|nr:hypothetical protein [Chloroflexota bacterium]
MSSFLLFRSPWLALIALGLWASLVPQVTFVTASSGQPAGDVLVAWGGWAVQQDLGPLSGTVGRFRIWVSVEPEPDGRELTAQASLVDAATNEVLRQTLIEVAPAYIPPPRDVTFPSYVVPEGQRLLLQLQVGPEFADTYVTYRLANPQRELPNLMLNGVPDAGSGPLAFTHLDTRSGLRAALQGDMAERIRLVLAVAFSALAILTSQLRRIGTAARRLAPGLAAWRPGRLRPGARAAGAASSTGFGRVLAVPWYPWPAAAAPILHFLTSNPLHFAAGEALLPLGLALMVVTGSVLGLRLMLHDWHRPAAATAAVTVVFFAYGHVERTLNAWVGEHVLFTGAVVLGAAAVGQIVSSSRAVPRWTLFLNVMALALLAFAVASLAAPLTRSIGRTPAPATVLQDEHTARLLPAGLPSVSRHRPDMYYIILDAYARHDALGEFDNSEFLAELERRGFYVASKATSNYTGTLQSIPSSINMSYLADLGYTGQLDEVEEMIELFQNNSLARILQGLGYTYVHLASGFPNTDSSSIADILVKFTPSGIVTIRDGDKHGATYIPESSSPGEGWLARSGGFLRSLIDTTALRPIVGRLVQIDDDDPYDWRSSRRAIQMFEFLASPIVTDGPKFVFAHFLKPHEPATFDQFGNSVSETYEPEGFKDGHDPSVPDAFTGQLIHINALTLKMIDGILQNRDEDPIIVIAGDHGRDHDYPKFPILAAFYLPDGGDSVLYPSISSVNHFRAILDYYFDLDIGLLPDRTVE